MSRTMTIEECARVIVHCNDQFGPIGLDEEFKTMWADEIADTFTDEPWAKELQAAIIAETERHLAGEDK